MIRDMVIEHWETRMKGGVNTLLLWGSTVCEVRDGSDSRDWDERWSKYPALLGSTVCEVRDGSDSIAAVLDCHQIP